MACTIVTTFGSTGDLNPFVALALALRSNGHGVMFAVEANCQQQGSLLGFPISGEVWYEVRHKSV
jgi:UDP:flavonoid glycosyltransferase YjiC (YdhE family)